MSFAIRKKGIMVYWIIYGVGYFLVWRPLFRGMVNSVCSGGNIEGEDVVMGVFTASFLALMWPPILIGFVISKGIRRISGAKTSEDVFYAIAGRTPEEKQQLKAKELKDRETKIRKAEVELGIGD